MPAKLLLLQIARCSERSVADTGDIDASKVADLLERALDGADRHLTLLGLGEFIASALTGSVIDPRL